MGLNIDAASHLRYFGPIPHSDDRDRLEQQLADQGKAIHDVYFFLYPNEGHHQARLVAMEPGLYEYTERTKHYSFRAGSCGKYNGWRRRLAQFAHHAEPEEVWEHPSHFDGQPFVELIDFTDCDGRIGTTIAAKLAADFREHRKLATDFATTLAADEAESWLKVFDLFARAFELAAQDGAVEFC